MLLPLPMIIGWYLAVSTGGKFTGNSIQRVYDFAPWIGLSFLALAVTIAVFIRIRQRWLKVGLLAISGAVTITLVVYYTTGQLNTFTFLGLVLVLWGVLLVPPLLERQLKSGRRIFRIRKHRMHLI